MTTTTTPQHTTRPNKTLEVHSICTLCANDTGTALCGSRLVGIAFPKSTTVTCVVCPHVTRCESCGRTRTLK